MRGAVLSDGRVVPGQEIANDVPRGNASAAQGRFGRHVRDVVKHQSSARGLRPALVLDLELVAGPSGNIHRLHGPFGWRSHFTDCCRDSILQILRHVMGKHDPGYAYFESLARLTQ